MATTPHTGIDSPVAIYLHENGLDPYDVLADGATLEGYFARGHQWHPWPDGIDGNVVLDKLWDRSAA